MERITINYDDGPSEGLENVLGILNKLEIKYTQIEKGSTTYIDWELPSEEKSND